MIFVPIPRLLLILLLLAPVLATAELALPEKPENCVFDDANIFEQSARERLVNVLQSEKAKYGITVYVATIPELEKSASIGYSDRLRDAWIVEPMGFILVYARNTDKILISLTPAAFKKLSEKGKVNDLADEIDRFNQEGPTRGIPKAINAILNRLRIAKEEAVFNQPEKQASPLLLIIPILIVLTALGFGLWKLYRFLYSQNVFDHAYHLRARPVQPHFGAMQGGIDTAVGKFR